MQNKNEKLINNIKEFQIEMEKPENKFKNAIHVFSSHMIAANAQLNEIARQSGLKKEEVLKLISQSNNISLDLENIHWEDIIDLMNQSMSNTVMNSAKMEALKLLSPTINIDEDAMKIEINKVGEILSRASHNISKNTGKTLTEIYHELSLHNRNIKDVTNQVVANAIEEDEELNRICKEMINTEGLDKVQRVLSSKCEIGVVPDDDEVMELSIQRSVNSYNKK